VLLAAHGAALGQSWRTDVARLVLTHRLGGGDPLAAGEADTAAIESVLAALCVSSL
jgi:hypothetical protein